MQMLRDHEVALPETTSNPYVIDHFRRETKLNAVHASNDQKPYSQPLPLLSLL